MTITGIGDLGLIACAVFFIILGLLVLTCTRWYASPDGRGLGAFFIVIDLIMGWSALRTVGVIPPGEATLIARAVLFNLLGVVMLVLIIGFIRLQFMNLPNRTEGKDNDHKEVLDQDDREGRNRRTEHVHFRDRRN